MSCHRSTRGSTCFVPRLIKITSRQQQTQRTLLDWLRVEYPGIRFQAAHHCNQSDSTSVCTWATTFVDP
jgi:hypothetical protein